MKSTDRTILLVLPAVAVLIAFWVLVIGPKQSEAGDLTTKVADLQSSLSAAQNDVAAGEAARSSFRRNYADVVSLGAAAPADDDQATLLYDMSQLGRKNHVRFRSFQVTASSDAAAAAPAATDVAPTETAVATLPLGATVGSAGLTLMPYNFNFFGNFFNIADFFGDLDDQVDVFDGAKGPDVRGRLMTVDGFALTANPRKGFPAVQADFSVTTYIVPADEGVDAGATPTGPAATTTPEATVTSTPAPTTATVTP